MHTNCVFCTIPQDHPDQIIEQTELAYVIMSNPAKVKGHLLVLPVRHAWQPWDLSDAENLEITRLSNKYRQKLEALLGPGSDTRQQYRPFIEPSEFHNLRHYHLHILPRQLNDELHQLSSKNEPVKHLGEDERQKFIERLQ